MSVQPERRYHRFRMCKAHLISEDRSNEVTANAKRQKEEAVRIAAAIEQAEGEEDSDKEEEEEDDDDETGTQADGMSPKNYLD
eukprot:4481063-Amphidinium_carterae.1